MKFKIFIVLFIIFFKHDSFSQKKSISLLKGIRFSKIELLLKKDTITFICSDFGSTKLKPTILFLQGSTAKPIIYSINGNLEVSSPFELEKYLNRFNFVFIARKGIPMVGEFQKLEKTNLTFVDENGKEPSKYIPYNNIIYRTYQANMVVNYLYKQKWIQKDSIFVVGHSEGYRVAAKLSEFNNKISKLVCMSANPINRSSDEILNYRIKALNIDNDSIYQCNVDKLIKQFAEIKDDIEVYKNEYSTYNWLSYEKNMPFESLKKYTKPILIVYGTKDFGSLQNDLLPFLLSKKDLTLKAYPNLDHNYFKKEYDKEGKKLEDSFHWNEVFEDVVQWLLRSKK